MILINIIIIINNIIIMCVCEKRMYGKNVILFMLHQNTLLASSKKKNLPTFLNNTGQPHWSTIQHYCICSVLMVITTKTAKKLQRGFHCYQRVLFLPTVALIMDLEEQTSLAKAQSEHQSQMMRNPAPSYF